MPLIAPIGGGDKQLPPEGQKIARLVSLVDMGTHPQEYKGEKKPDARELNFGFELPTELAEYDGEEYPMMMYKQAKFKRSGPNSQMKSTLNKIIAAVGDDEFDPKHDILSMVGKMLYLKIVHRTGEKGDVARIEDFLPIPDEMQDSLKDKKYNQVNPNDVFVIGPDMDLGALESKPDWIKEKISQSPEFKAHTEKKN